MKKSEIFEISENVETINDSVIFESGNSENFFKNNEKPKKRKNVNIADCFPLVKKHPYLTLGVVCALLHFGTYKGNLSLWFVAVTLCCFTMAFVSYMKKTTKDFVLSPRGVLFALPFALSVCVTAAGFNSGAYGIFIGSFFFFFSLLVIYLILKFTGRMTVQNTVLLIFLVGLFLRVIYVLYTSAALESSFWFYKSMAKAWIIFNSALEIGSRSAIEGMQFVSVFCSSACMVTGYKIFKELGLFGKRLIRATAFISLFPWFIFSSGDINSDTLSVTLGFVAILTTIKWYKNPEMSKLIVVALVSGFSMALKLSMGIVAIAVVFVFLTKFKAVCQKRENVIFTKKGEKTISSGWLIGGFVLFVLLVVSSGLGLQMKRLMIGDTVISEASEQFIGFRSPLERLFGMNLHSLTSHFVVRGGEGSEAFWEYNMFLGGLKTSLFGEDTLFALGAESSFKAVVLSTVGNVFCKSLYIFSICLVVLGMISLYFFFKNKYYGINKTFARMFIVIFAMFVINYILICFLNPYTCAMDFGYAVLCLFLPTLSLSVVTCEEKKRAFFAEKVFFTASGVCVKGFFICMAVSYVLLSLMPC